jgi:hypothetical protein
MDFDPPYRRSQKEAADDRQLLMEGVDEFVSEMVMWCDDKEDLLALGSILLVSAKNVMTTAMDLDNWKKTVTEYIKRVGTDNDLSLQAIKRRTDY